MLTLMTLYRTVKYHLTTLAIGMQKAWAAVGRLYPWWRIPCKFAILLLFVLLVLFPNPVLLVRQIQSYANVERLIHTDFDGIDQINREITASLPPDATPRQEYQAVQRYVYDHIAYVYDWEQWLNVDYWPTAAEVWQRQREDCDGQAVLAVSILRSRGFASARLAGNIRHIWVTVDQTALMGAESEQTVRREDGKIRISLPSWELWLGSLAIGIADFQEFRSLLLYCGVLLVCYRPGGPASRFFAAAAPGLLGFIFLKDWADLVMRTRETTANLSLWAGAILVLGSLFLAARQPRQ